MLQENLIHIYERSFRKHRDLPALTDYFRRETFTYLETAERIARLHLFFEELGIRPGDKIALIGRNTPSWCITYLATITYGAVIVPILQDFTPTDVVHIINHSESRLLFIGDSFWEQIEEDQIPQIEAVFSLTDYGVLFERPVPAGGSKPEAAGAAVDGRKPETEKPAAGGIGRPEAAADATAPEPDGRAAGIPAGQSGESPAGRVAALREGVADAFAARYPQGFTADDIHYSEVPNDRMALLSYTSGTTGYSKGVMLTINNLTGNVLVGLEAIDPATGDLYFRAGGRILSFLPLAHAFGCAFDFLAPIACGLHVTLLGRIPSPKILLEAMASVRPNVICCVPLILEKVYRKQVLPMLEKGPVSIAVKIPLLNTAIYSVIRKKLTDAFGGSCAIFIVGGAPMNQETESFLLRIGFPLTVGYGMTECAPLISFTPAPEYKSGSCGRYIAGHLEVRIDSEAPADTAGEILVRGDHVMQGYYKNEKETKKVLDPDGWLHTGDMGTMDPDGTLYIRGRSKTMILSASGQNIYPEEIEDRLNNMYLVLESLVLDAGGGRLKALVVPDFEQAEKEGIDKNDLPAIMQENMRQLNTQLAAYERLGEVVLYPTEFEKTPKRSIKRYLYETSLLNR